MKVMVIMKATTDSEAGKLPSTELLTAMGKYNEELVKAGIMLDGAGLHPTTKGKRVRFSKDAPAVIDGPFSGSNDLISGFWMWEVKSMEEAVAWAKKIPNPGGEHSEVELRRVFAAEDFGENLTPELRAAEEELEKQLRERK